MESVKTCVKCGKELPLDQFRQVRHRSGNIGHRSECMDCARIIAARYRENNLDKVRALAVARYWSDLDRGRDKVIRWRKDNPEKSRAASNKWKANNPEKRDKCRKDNPRYRAVCAKRHRSRRANDLNFRMKANIASAMSSALTRGRKVSHTTELLGCSIEELRDYLERLFLPGMTWGNYGKDGWHIDHIIPLSYFDMSNPEQQKRAWHYTNLQPLWAKDNIRKSNKIIEQQLVLL